MWVDSRVHCVTMAATLMKGTVMTYYVAVLIEDGQWQETFGSHCKRDVENEVRDWRDHGAKGRNVRRFQWASVPSQHELIATVAPYIHGVH